MVLFVWQVEEAVANLRANNSLDKSKCFIDKAKYDEILKFLIERMSLEEQYSASQLRTLTVQENNWRHRYSYVDRGGQKFLVPRAALMKVLKSKNGQRKIQKGNVPWIVPTEDFFEYVWDLHMNNPGKHRLGECFTPPPYEDDGYSSNDSGHEPSWEAYQASKGMTREQCRAVLRARCE